ncbi:CRISPR type III-A-associated RAMP protein Csm4 [Paenibacillus pabuli]|uniref:CRISPR type III-A-associated RAMP protein Csm4 n=1 Tax=Paenibacillus pabuli TaxID=1472 RepID=A0ABX9BEU1_9BACL|nr:hypothetical protein [Paenibacillus pabuli]RAI89591.1 CRISPR type III-A-associated RAMP protein Csm4 [Paenibacillus pabuli]
MAKWTYYRIDLGLIGGITQLPDSQKIFGALIHRFSEVHTSSQTTQMVKQIQEGSLPFALSNLLPQGYFPAPHTELLDQFSAEDRNNKSQYKALKQRTYVKKEQLVELIEGKQPVDQIYPYVYIEFTQQTHVSLDSKRYNLPGLDPNVYSVPGVIVKEVLSERMSKTVQEFSFYLALANGTDGDELLQMLRMEIDRAGIFILGPRGSQGLNTFVVTRIQEEKKIASHQAGTFLNLGMLLPNQIDFSKSSLKLFTSERRPYNPLGGWEEAQHQGKFISFIEAGSIVYASEGIHCAAQSIESPFSSRDVVFGNALLYPLSVKEED